MFVEARLTRRGPALSGVCLRIRTDFFQTRGRARLSARQSVHTVRASDGAFPRHHQARGNAQGAVSKAHRAVSGGVHNYSHGDVECTPMIVRES